MFKSEARLFISANNNVNSAKTLINECKRLVADFSLEGNSDSQNFKSNINNCNIDALVTKIENTKESLMKLDQTFAGEYMALLQENLQTTSIDTSNMTDEERMQYNIQMNNYYRDYNQNLLYMLEKYEESGMLTDEMKGQLQYQRELIAQFELQDKMAILDPTSEEYINLFKENAEHDRQLIKLNPNLTEEQKASYLEEYETQYNQNLEALNATRDERLKKEADEKELEELYASKEDNNGFWHPFVESEIDEAILNKKIEMGIASEDEIAYKNMNGWDRFWTNTGTFMASTYVGLYDITEGIGDGLTMLGSAVGICDKDWASEYISRDLSGELYQGIQLSTGMNSWSAYGTWHTAGDAFGGFVGKVGMSFAAPWANAVLSGLEAMGQSAETSFNNGDEYWAVFGKSLVSGVGGAAEGYAFSKMNLGIRNFVSSGALKTLGGTALSGIKNFGATLTSPGGLKVIGGNLLNLSKSGLKHIPSALGKAGLATLKDTDAIIETGCVFVNNLIECATTGEWDFAKMAKEVGSVALVNYFMSFVTTLAFDINTKKPNIDTPTPVADDLYINKAQDILDPNTATNLSSEIGKLNNDELQKVLTVMNGTEIASQLKYLESSEVDRVLHSLSGSQTTELVGEIAERFSKDGIDADLFRKIDPSLQLEILERTDITQTLVHARTNPDGAILILDEISKGNYGYDLGYEEVKKMLKDTTRGMAYSSADAATAIINMEKYFEINYNEILDDKLWYAAKDSLPPGASSTQIKAQIEVIKSDPKLFKQVVDTTNNAAASNLLVVQKNMISALSDETINGVPKAYNNATDFFADMAEKKSGNLSSRVTSEYKDYVTKQFDPTGSGVSRVGSFYSNDNLKFVCNIPGEQTSALLLKEMLNGSEIISVEVGSFGRIGDRQFVSAALEQENLIDSINRFGGDARTTVAAATGLPSTGTDRLVRITGDTPTSMLELHSGIEGGSNYQAVSGGLPDYEFNGTRHMMVESTIPAVQTGSRNFTNVKFDVYNPDTAQLINSYELVQEGNKWFLKLIQ